VFAFRSDQLVLRLVRVAGIVARNLAFPRWNMPRYASEMICSTVNECGKAGSGGSCIPAACRIVRTALLTAGETLAVPDGRSIWSGGLRTPRASS
jgi:hypothetical protein